MVFQKSREYIHTHTKFSLVSISAEYRLRKDCVTIKAGIYGEYWCSYLKQHREVGYCVV